MSEGKVGVGTAIIIMLLLGVLVGVFNGFNYGIKNAGICATLASSNVTAGLALYISMGKTIIGLPLEYSFIGLKRLQVCHFAYY